MSKPFRAIYENGVFRPLESIEGLNDRSTVHLRFETSPAGSGFLSDLAGMWTEQEAEEIEALIEAVFEKVDSREW